MVSLLLLKVKQEELIEFIMFETENFEQAKVTEENYQGFLGVRTYQKSYNYQGHSENLKENIEVAMIGVENNISDEHIF
ncbi:hypothetical protein HK228_09035, partial [Streptococcus agalactiae]|nr:hypothetical protein [Streptococcus agalactiae]